MAARRATSFAIESDEFCRALSDEDCQPSGLFVELNQRIGKGGEVTSFANRKQRVSPVAQAMTVAM